MESTSLSEIITNHLIESYPVKKNSRGNIVIDDFSFSGAGLAKKVHKRFLADRKKYKDIHEPFLLMDTSEIIEELSSVLDTVKENIHIHLAAQEMSETTENISVRAIKDAYMSVIPVVDVEDVKGTAYMVDKDSGRLSLLQEKSWERIVGSKHVSIVREVGYGGRFQYNPKSTDAFIQGETVHGEEMIYNKFIPPIYRLERDYTAKLDPRFIAFLDGLFQDGCKSYAFNWLYHSCFRRIPTYLVLVGAGGIGKNLLAEALKQIHTDNNFTKAPPSALDTKFNGHLEDCTMLYYDECKFSAGKEGVTTRKNRLKEWANDCVPIEKKGVDARNKDIFCSAIIATNNDSDVHLEQLDRKFSVMELSEDRLEKRMGVEDTQFLWKYILEPEFADAFLNYLEQFIDPEFNPYMEYKGPKFDQLVLSSLYGWQQELLDRIQNAQTTHISIKDCRENISLFPKHNTKVDDFLKNFTVDRDSLGKIVTIDGSPKIKINEKFLPKENEGMNLDKEL